MDKTEENRENSRNVKLNLGLSLNDNLGVNSEKIEDIGPFIVNKEWKFFFVVFRWITRKWCFKFD